MGETKDSATVGGDELLLGDGFSVVDSTKSDTQNNGTDGQKPEDESVETETKPEPTDDATTKEEAKHDDDEEVKEDPGKVNGVDAKSDALLITTEEDLELTDKKTEDADTTKEEPEEKEEKKKEEKPEKSRKQGDVWVSNITRHVKATDLKKHFSKHGKVLTAKIVTNGKSFFGYILMETGDVANKCVKALNGSTLDGRKLTVSRQRPDQRRVPPSDRARTVKPSSRRTTTSTHESKKEVKEKPKEKRDASKDRDKDALIQARRNEERMRRECDYLKREVSRLKRFTTEEQRRARNESQRNRTLQREIQDLEAKMRDERRKFERDRELWEKNQRTDRIKMEADRTLMKKELDEVKKLREYLKRKLEEEAARPAERRPRASSPYAYSSKRFRDSSDNKKYVEERTRTPPSPPKLSRNKNRSPNVASFEKDRRSGGGHHYGMEREVEGRHGSSLVVPAKPAAPAPPRNIWPSTFHQEVWRVPPSGPNPSAPFASSSGQGSYRQSDYGGSSSSKTSNYSQQRDFGKRDHYNSSSVRKY